MYENKTLIGITLALSLLVVPLAVQAESGATLDQLQKQLDAQEDALQKTQQQLQRLQLQTQTPPDDTQSAAPQSRQTAGQQPVQPVGEKPPSQQKEEAAKVAPVMEQPGILTPKGHFTVEPSIQYSYSSTSRADLVGFTVLPAIVVGLVDVREVKGYTAVGALTGRYGLTPWLEATLKLPYVYRDEKAITRPLSEGASQDSVFNTSGSDLGDIEFALRYQFNQGGPSLPYFIGSLRGIFPTGTGPYDVDYSSDSRAPGGGMLRTELPTGSGFYGIETGLSAIYPSDPVVFYGNVNYLWRLSKDIDKDIFGSHIGKVDPGDSFKLGFGMGQALNERSSLSLGYQHTYISKTRTDGLAASDTTAIQLGQLLLGFGYQLTPDTSLNLSVAAGLTEDTPDVELTFRVPITF